MRPSATIIRRRRLAALLVLAALVALIAAVSGAGSGDQAPGAAADGDAPAIAPAPGRDRVDALGSAAPEVERAEARPAASSAGGLRSPAVREAGRTIVMRFDGTAAPDYVLRALRERRAAGVILFRDNITSPGQLRAMTRALQRAGGGRVLVMTDQEGGEIRNLRFGAPAKAPPALATVGAARAAARAAARDLRAAGVNVNLAPVADVATTPRSIMRTRAFPGGAGQVARLVGATVRAYDGTGVLPTAKHFPGLGRSTTNTDFDLATVPGRGDLAPFAAAIEAGVPLVMSSHALYPDLDADRIASQSRRVMTTLLRERLGFRGVLITDSLEAQSVVRRSSTAVAAARSLAAGSDLLLTTGKGSYLEVLRRLVADARRTTAFRARLREAGERVTALRARLG